MYFFPELVYFFLELVYFFLELVYFFPELVYFFPELVFFFPELVYFFPELVYFFLELVYVLPELVYVLPDWCIFYLNWCIFYLNWCIFYLVKISQIAADYFLGVELVGLLVYCIIFDNKNLLCCTSSVKVFGHRQSFGQVKIHLDIFNQTKTNIFAFIIITKSAIK